MNYRKKIEEIVICALHNMSDEYVQLSDINPEMKLYNGFGGCLDSLALVNLVSDLESILSKELQKDIIIADDKMMSSRNSPFKDIKSLIDYIVKKLQEQE
ncbi:hypothetical protein [Campylobacter insulaenigrae]|uniref:hypothetical protein n=1 Tax=Campylobacter insulaenigrae TaxID=260714 RepID=UPI0021530F53|nr:hypothetical protein [Campylobacter insulaenigrae]MCR6587602.1 hypothetical protein [Campylobacter insulaenigrae]